MAQEEQNRQLSEPKNGAAMPTSPGQSLEPTQVSLAFSISLASTLSPIREALEVIDRVHWDGRLPKIPVALTRSVRASAEYRYTERGAALGLALSRASEHPHLSIVHEIGHFLDHQALGEPGKWASEAGLIADVMQVIVRSRAIQRLGTLTRQQSTIVKDARGRRLRVPIDRAQVRYYLESKEIFARAYAQWVTLRSGDLRLSRQLDQIRNPAELARMYHSQWTDDDFAPVAEALNRLFIRKGWLNDRT